jgi:hypothetical protein
MIIDATELKEIELRCECGSSIHFPIPTKQPLPSELSCLNCGRAMWLSNTVRGKIEAIVNSLADWSAAGYSTLALKFVLMEKE